MNLPRYQQPVLPQGANLRHHNYRLSDPKMYVSANQMYGAKADIGRSLASAMQVIGNNIRSDRLRDEANARADQIRAEQQARQDARYAVQDQRYADQQARKDALFKMEQDKHKRWYVEQGQEDADRTIGNESRSLKLDEARANHRHKVLMSLHNASRGVKNQNEWNNLIQRYNKLGYGDIIKPYADYETGNRLLSSEMQAGGTDLDALRRQKLQLEVEKRRREMNAPPGQGKPPAGYKWGADGELEAIPGGPATKLPGELAGRVAIMSEGVRLMPKIRELLGIKGPGQTDDPAQPMGTVDQRRIGMVLQTGRGGQAHRMLLGAIEGVLRGLTGAAATKPEVDRLMDMYGPASNDTAATMEDKLNRLESLIRRQIATMAGGRGGNLVSDLGPSGGPKIKSITPIE